MNDKDFSTLFDKIKRASTPATQTTINCLRAQIKNSPAANEYEVQSVASLVLTKQVRGFFHMPSGGPTNIQRAEWEDFLKKIDLEIVDTFQKELGSNWHVKIAGAQIWARKNK